MCISRETIKMSALLQEKNQLSLFGMSEEVQLYHDSQRHGFFSILQNVKSTKRQRSYKLAEMPQVLSLFDPSRDSWMSQAEFFKPNRRVVNLWRVGLLFVDLDTYNVPHLRERSTDYLVGMVLHHCDDLGIPPPSITVFSGRGLQVKWLLENPLPRAALPRWNACQRVLVERLKDLGSDPQAKDASRVLRLVQTVNSKNGKVCHVAHMTEKAGKPIAYDFEYLCEMLLPFTRDQIAQMRLERASARAKRPANRNLKILAGGQAGLLRRFSGRQLAWHRLEDLRTLAELRGGYKTGERMLHLFWQLNFLLLSGATNQNQMWHEAAAIARGIDNQWGYRTDELSTLFQKAKQYEAGERIEFNGKLYPALYTPKNDTLINQFEITDDEQRNLRTIISRDIAKERDAERKRAVRAATGAVTKDEYNSTRAVEMQQRKKQALELRGRGMSYRSIAHELKVSLASVHKYLAQK